MSTVCLLIQWSSTIQNQLQLVFQRAFVTMAEESTNFSEGTTWIKARNRREIKGMWIQVEWRASGFLLPPLTIQHDLITSLTAGEATKSIIGPTDQSICSDKSLLQDTFMKSAESDCFFRLSGEDTNKGLLWTMSPKHLQPRTKCRGFDRAAWIKHYNIVLLLLFCTENRHKNVPSF